MSATALDDRVNNLTLPEILSKVGDTVSRSTALGSRVFRKMKPWNGRVITQPIFTDESDLGQYFNSVETFSTEIDQNTTNMTWYPTGFAQPVGVSLFEQSVNETQAGVISLLQSSMDYASMSLRNRLGTDLYVTATGKAFDGLENFIDDGTENSSYAGLSRTTYGTNINADVTNTATLDLDVLAASDDAASVAGLMELTPNVLLTTPAVWSNYESLLEPAKLAMYQATGVPMVTWETATGETVKTNGGMMGKGGYLALDFRNKLFIKDNACPTGNIFGVNEMLADFHSLTIKGLKTIGTGTKTTEGVYDKVHATALQFREMMTPTNQLAEIGIFVVAGNLIHRNPRFNFRVFGITGV